MARFDPNGSGHCGNTLIQWINPLLYNQLVYLFSQSLRAEAMEKVHRLPLSYLDKQGAGTCQSSYDRCRAT